MAKRTTKLMGAALLAFALSGGAFAQQNTVSPKLPAAGWAPAGSPVAVHGQLSVSGSKIVDKDGKDVVLRGLSMFWSNSNDGRGFYTDDIVGWLAQDWKISVIRAAMGVDSLQSLKDNTFGGGGNPGYLKDKGQKGLVETVVKAAISRGIYVIIDWHTHFAQNYTAAAQEFFREMATTWGAYPNIIYEIYNEPENANWSSQIVPYSNTVVSAIRAIDSKNIIIIGNEGHSSNPQTAGNVTGTHLTYAMHFYAGSHMGDYRTRVTNAINMSRAVFVSEFGTCHYSGNGSYNESSTNEWFTLMETTHKVSWVNWAVTNKNETAAIFTSSAGTSSNWGSNNLPALTTSGTFIRGKIRGYNAAYTIPSTATIATTTEGQGDVARIGGNGPYAFNSTVTLTATPAPGWEFIGWGDDAAGTNPSLSVRVTGVNFNIKAKFIQGSMITNGSFTNNADGWSGGGNAAALYESLSGNGALRVNVTAGWSASTQVRQTGIGLVNGRRYELTFRAKTVTGSGSITPRFSNSNANLNYMDTAAVQLTASWQTFKKEFNMCSSSDANSRLIFHCGGPNAFSWHLDDVTLNDIGAAPAGACSSSSVLQPWIVTGARGAWSIVRAGSLLQLRGPAEAGAKVSLYDTRGKMVKSMAARDGMSISGLPAGNYFVTIKDSAGKEVLRTKALIVQ